MDAKEKYITSGGSGDSTPCGGEEIGLLNLPALKTTLFMWILIVFLITFPHFIRIARKRPRSRVSRDCRRTIKFTSHRLLRSELLTGSGSASSASSGACSRNAALCFPGSQSSFANVHCDPPGQSRPSNTHSGGSVCEK